MAVRSDPHGVGRHDDVILRRFLDARRAGDEPAAQRWWRDIVTDNFDRVRGMVRAESHGRLSSDEQEEAVQRALIRIATRLIDTFRGTSMGEWVEAVRKLVHFTCMDTQRDAMRISKRQRSLDDALSDGAGAEYRDTEVYEAITKREREREAAEEDEEALHEARSFLDRAVPQLSPKRRAVIELDRRGINVEEIQRMLGVSRDVVYAARSRALKDLAKLRDEHERP